MKRYITVFFACLVCFVQISYAQQVSSTAAGVQQLFEQSFAAFQDFRMMDAEKNMKKAYDKDPENALFNSFMAVIRGKEGGNAYLEKAKANMASASEWEKLMIQSNIKSFSGVDDVTEMEKLSAMFPQNNTLQLMLAFAYGGTNQAAKSKAKLEAMVAKSPNYAPTYNILGYTYMQEGNMEKAKSYFEKYIALAPNLSNPYDSMGDYYMATKDLDKAIEFYEKAYAKDPVNNKVSKDKAEKAKKAKESTH